MARGTSSDNNRGPPTVRALHPRRNRNQVFRFSSVAPLLPGGQSKQMPSVQPVTGPFEYWPCPCSFPGMQSSRGFTLFELLIVVAMIGILGAIGLPVLSDSSNRNKVWTATEQVASQIRQARL